MSRAVAQWLVRATDDRVVAVSNPSDTDRVSDCRRFETWGVGQVRLPHIAYIRSTVYFDIISCWLLLYGVYDRGSKNMFVQ